MKTFTERNSLSLRRACDLCCMSRSQYSYLSQKKEDPEIIKALLEIKEKHPYYGTPRVLAVLRRHGFTVNGKRVWRLLKTLRLCVPRKIKRKHIFIAPTKEIPDAIGVGSVWSIDFVFDRLKCGTPFRCFTVIDNYSRQVPDILISKSMAGFLPVDFLEELKGRFKLPSSIILDNGVEFVNEVFVQWCNDNKISLHFIDPGKPVQNAYVESFNGKFRKEFLEQNKFKTISEAKLALESWLIYYNEQRPHSSLDYLTPKEFAEQELGVLDKKNNLLVLKTG